MLPSCICVLTVSQRCLPVPSSLRPLSSEGNLCSELSDSGPDSDSGTATAATAVQPSRDRSPDRGPAPSWPQTIDARSTLIWRGLHAAAAHLSPQPSIIHPPPPPPPLLPPPRHFDAVRAAVAAPLLAGAPAATVEWIYWRFRRQTNCVGRSRNSIPVLIACRVIRLIEFGRAAHWRSRTAAREAIRSV